MIGLATGIGRIHRGARGVSPIGAPARVSLFIQDASSDDLAPIDLPPLGPGPRPGLLSSPARAGFVVTAVEDFGTASTRWRSRSRPGDATSDASGQHFTLSNVEFTFGDFSFNGLTVNSNSSAGPQRTANLDITGDIANNDSARHTLRITATDTGYNFPAGPSYR